MSLAKELNAITQAYHVNYKTLAIKRLIAYAKTGAREEARRGNFMFLLADDDLKDVDIRMIVHARLQRMGFEFDEEYMGSYMKIEWSTSL